MIVARENCSFTTDSQEETERAGQSLSGILINRDLIVLTGVLGAGKTCFIRGIAGGLDVPIDEVKSPSFTLVNEYTGRMPVYHFDLYRMKEDSELYNIGWDDYMQRDGIMVVEWGERANGYLPDKYININIEIISENCRGLTVSFGDES